MRVATLRIQPHGIGRGFDGVVEFHDLRGEPGEHLGAVRGGNGRLGGEHSDWDEQSDEEADHDPGFSRR